MMSLQQDKQSGFFVRGPADRKIIYESKNYLPLFTGLAPGFLALDIGAHIGSFARLCAHHNAEFIACYEPYPPSFELLKRNLKTLDVRTITFNIATGEHGTGELFIATNPANNSLCRVTSESITVKQAEFSAIVGIAAYSVVKIDIEGAEYSIQIEALPASVRRLAIELHTCGDIPRMHARILSMGFTPIDSRISEYVASGRCVLGLYKR